MRLGKFKIFTFVKPSSTATMFSHVIAQFLSEQLGEPITWSADVGKQDLDTLVVVAGGSPFCGCLPALARGVLRSERVIFVQNDYHSKFPTPTGKGKSPYRAAFRLRRKRGMSDPDWWTTLEEKSRLTENSALINWNMLAWNPSPTLAPLNWDTLFYYGSWRKERVPLFDKYFLRPFYITYVANNSGRFEERYPRCRHVQTSRQTLVDEMRRHGAGLFMEDPESGRHNTSLPCRFYEMLGAGVPMFFDASSWDTMKRHGYDVSEYVVNGPRDVGNLMSDRKRAARAQRDWRDDFRNLVTEDLMEAAT